MDISTFFVRGITIGAIDGAADYFETVNSGLQAAKAQDLEAMRDQIRALGLKGQELQAEWEVATQNHDATHGILLPNYFRYSYVVLLYLITESRLAEICRAAAQVKTLQPPARPKGYVIEAYREYLEQTVGISAVGWDAIQELRMVRNCVVHGSGRVIDDKHEDCLRDLAERTVGLYVSGETYELEDGTLPLYLEDGMLMLTPDYCRNVTKSVKTFFEELCDAVTLPRLTIAGREL